MKNSNPRKQRTLWRSTRFLGKAAVLLSLFMAVVHTAYLFAAHQLDNLVVAINADQYMQNMGSFVFLRESAIIPVAAIVPLALVILLLGHFLVFGSKKAAEGGEPGDVAWWTVFERVCHALVAVSFLVLLFSGLLITFGRYVSVGQLGVYVRQSHDYAGFVFTPFFVILLAQWFREALPRKYDWDWLLHMGGYLGYKGKLEAGKFDAGQKLWYWILLFSGGVLVITGFGLFFAVGNMATFRLYVMLHFLATGPIIAMFIVHLYIVTIGFKGAWISMLNGRISMRTVLQFHSRADVLKGPTPA
jgi:formate dehydrogenase subunit gamma